MPGQAEPGCMCVRACVCLTGILRCGKLRPEEIVVVGTATTYRVWMCVCVCVCVCVRARAHVHACVWIVVVGTATTTT